MAARGPGGGFVADYNGTGSWSLEQILARYQRYCRELGLRPGNIQPLRFSQGGRTWIYPVMHAVIDGIKRNEPASVRIGIDFIEEDQGFPFGKLIKSDTARALRQHATLDTEQKERLRRRFTDMLVRGYLPREYKEYAKLFRKLGLDHHADEIARADQSNSFIRRWSHYLLTHHEASRRQNRLRHW